MLTYLRTHWSVQLSANLSADQGTHEGEKPEAETGGKEQENKK